MVNDLLLLSGLDVPFEAAGIFIHPPRLRDIALIGEDKFFTGCELLKFSKDILSEEDKNALVNISDFEILLSIISDKSNIAIQKNVESALMVLTILFSDYEIGIEQKRMVLTDKEGEQHFFTSEMFVEFKRVLAKMLCLEGKENDALNYKPANAQAEKIAKLLLKGRAQAAAAKGLDKNKPSILSRYISILAVGEQKDINQIMQYTIYQLYDEFERYQLKVNQDIHTQAMMAGATGLKEIENWMGDIHSKSSS